MAVMDNEFIEEWLRSPQTSLYYSLQVMGDVQDKSNAYAALEESWRLMITCHYEWTQDNMNLTM